MLGKMGRKIALAALVGVAGVAFSGNSAMAGSTVLGDSGWTASWDDQFDGYIDISMDALDLENCTVYIEKSVNFTDGKFWNAEGSFFNPAVISFNQTTPNAVSNIVINDEQLTNNSGYDWDSFRMFLMGNNVTFDVAQSANFNVAPFTNMSFVDGNKELDISGGLVATGTTWFPGSGSGSLNQLWINANPSGDGLAAFTLKEQPHAIPLPAAAWSGLSGLVGLALLGSRKKLRGLIA